jgi:hypothetical protein
MWGFQGEASYFFILIVNKLTVPHRCPPENARPQNHQMRIGWEVQEGHDSLYFFLNAMIRSRLRAAMNRTWSTGRRLTSPYANTSIFFPPDKL